MKAIAGAEHKEYRFEDKEGATAATRIARASVRFRTARDGPSLRSG